MVKYRRKLSIYVLLFNRTTSVTSDKFKIYYNSTVIQLHILIVLLILIITMVRSELTGLGHCSLVLGVEDLCIHLNK